MTSNRNSQSNETTQIVAGLTFERTARLVAFAAFVWFCAAMFIRFAGPVGVFHSISGVLLYAATIPATIPLNERARKLAGLPRDLMVSVIAVTTATATMLDGVAMSCFPELYGGVPSTIQAGAVWLLWAIGVASALALVMPKLGGRTS
jgi:hypothetical protein